MKNLMRSAKTFLMVVAVGVAMFAATVTALADKLYLKDGRVLEGEVVRQDGDFVVFKVKGKTEAEFFEAKDVQKVEKDTAAKVEAPKADAPRVEAVKPAASAADAPKGDVKPEKGKGKQLTGKPPRIAVIPFGPPQSWKNNKDLAGVETLVGGEISSQAWMDIIPMLEKDGVDTVVVRINSGGGYTMEQPRFTNTFREYKKRFRIVGWVESSISCAAMSPWVISEFYMKPEGHIGGCTEWSGNGQATEGFNLLKLLDQMKQISLEAGRDPLIMRAMEIEQPLSCNIDDDGNVTFFGDTTSGSYVINRDRQVLTLNSEVAMKIKFAKGVAATPDELAKVMGFTEYTFGGEEAIKWMEDYMLKSHKSQVFFVDTALKYQLARNAAQQLANNPNDPRFGSELGKARQYLNEMKRQVDLNPNFPFILGNKAGVESMDERWFEEQERQLRELSRRAKEAEERRRKENR